MSKMNQLARSAMRHPLLWGAVATAGFYLALDSGVVEQPLLARYFAGHWAAYVSTTMFLVAMAALVVKAMDLVRDWRSLGATLFDGIPAADLRIADASLMVAALDKQPAPAQHTYLIQRLRAALDYLIRKGSPDSLEDQLRALADLDAERKAASFGIVRTMLWTMPFIGAVGTVMGLASAISQNAPEGAVNGITANLPPGFELILDTTVLSLLLTVTLLVVMLVAEHFENRLLAVVDARASRELIGRFRSLSLAKGAQPVSAAASVAAGSGLSDTMIVTMEKIASRQTEVWQASLDAATKHWEEQTDLLKKQIGSGGGGGGGGGGRGGKTAAGGGEAAQISEAIATSLSELGSSNLVINNEIMVELSEVIRKGCRNWPYRLRLRRSVRGGTRRVDDIAEWSNDAA